MNKKQYFLVSWYYNSGSDNKVYTKLFLAQSFEKIENFLKTNKKYKNNYCEHPINVNSITNLTIEI